MNCKFKRLILLFINTYGGVKKVFCINMIFFHTPRMLYSS